MPITRALSYPRAATLLVLSLTVLTGVAAGGTGGTGGDPVASSAQLPPLIERHLFFTEEAISGTKISPDGKWISFHQEYHGVVNLWLKRRTEPFSAARAVTSDEGTGVDFSTWSESSRWLLSLQDTGGDRDYHILAIDISKLTADGELPPARDLTPFANARAAIIAKPEATPNTIIVTLSDRDPTVRDVYRIDIETGKRTLLAEGSGSVLEWRTDLAGRVRLAYGVNERNGEQIVAVDGQGRLGKVLVSTEFGDSCSPERFHRDGRRVYVHCNMGADVDLMRLMLLDTETGQLELVESDPLGKVDIADEIFSDASEELIATVYDGDRRRFSPRDDRFRGDLEILQKRLGEVNLSIDSTSEDMRFWIITASSDVNPGTVYLYDRREGTIEQLFEKNPELPKEHLAAMTAISYPARDGLQIPAYLLLPRGVEPQRLPLVLAVHGGPWQRVSWDYSDEMQLLTNRGYAVLLPNFRGSTGFGKRFFAAGIRQRGTGAMQHDLSDGVQYLVDRGIADPERVAILGVSYGGYAALAGLSFTPDLYAAGISMAGPTNLVTSIRNIPPFRAVARRFIHRMVGNPDDPDDREMLMAKSPFYHVGRITAPLLIIQGANDPIVDRAEAEQMVVALRDLQRPVEYVLFPDEGHSISGRRNALAVSGIIEEFLARRLGGRRQQSEEPEIEELVKRLRVDTATLSLPERLNEELLSAPLPLPDVTRLAPHRLAYRTERVSGDGQAKISEISVELSRQRAGDGRSDEWVVQTSLGEGATTDRWVLDAETLLPRQRHASHGSATMSFTYAPEGVSGSIAMGGREMPVEAALPAPVAGEEMALDVLVAALPLEPGYTATLRTYDVMAQELRVWTLTVPRIERIAAAGGDIETTVAELRALGSDPSEIILWITSSAPHTVVRRRLTMPGPNGETVITSTLAR